MNSGIKNIIFASGRIKLFQVAASTLKMVAILFAYIVLKLGAPAYYLLYVYIVFTVLVFFANQWVFNKTLNYDNSFLWKKSYLPSFLIVLLFSPCFFLKLFTPQLIAIIVSFCYLCVLIALIGFNASERKYVIHMLSNKIRRK